MKYSLLRKPFSTLLLGLTLSAALFCGDAARVRAEETAHAEISDSGILQEGGFLEEDQNQGIMLLDADTDMEGAKKAITDALLNLCPDVDIYSFNIPKEQVSSLIRQVVNNNPRFFYYSGCSYSYSPSSGCVYTITFRYSSDADTLQPQVNRYEAAVQNILNGIQPSWSNLEKAMYVNDYIAVHCEYDTTYSKYSAYNALVDQTAVCQGYALAYQDLMNRLGIPCEYVSSSKLNHAWNLIQLGNSWYHVDVTWNDPINDRYGRARHIYFLKSTNWFKSPTTSATAHNADDYVYSGPAGDADAGSGTFDEYFWNKVDSPFGWYGGCWYANNGGSLYKYQFNDSGVTGTTLYKALNQNWPVFGGSGYWTGAYDGCIVYGNKLYYASQQSIQVLELSSGSTVPTTVYTISDAEKSQGYIYGFYLTDDGILKYGIAQSPNDAADRKEAVLHTHSYGSWIITKAPTCTEDGERTQTCSGCGMFRKETVEATGHTPGSEATCTEPQICTVCKIELAPALGHTPGTEATCTEPQICTVCKEELAPALGHTPGTAATCTEPQICTVCKIELVPALGHTPGSEATCTEPQICTTCGITLTEATGHHYDSGVITREPTCAEEGIRTFTCLEGDDSYTETIPKTDEHSFGAWTIRKDSTCTEEGFQYRTCSVCEITEEQTISKKEHTPGAAATCTEPQICTTCGVTLAEATGHHYDNGVITREPTCAEEGIKTFTCLEGDDSYTETIPKTTAHSFSAWTIRKDSTCTEEGFQYRTCSVCGATEEQTISKKEHTPGTAATCTEPQFCTTCGVTLTEATGHLHTETQVTREATFLKTGTASVVCTDCQTVLSTQKLAKVKCKKGQTYTVGSYKYKIVSAKTNGKGTVAFAGLAKNTSKVTIKDTVSILGVKFKIVQISDKALKNKTSVTTVTIGKNVQTIGKEAFSGAKKLKTITIKSTKITKVGSKALKNVNAKAKIKVPKAKLSKYKNLFKNKGQKNTVKIY